ncbi:MAG TPA: deaminase [Terriglobales bacterium]|nr:deaminase [Terriglobales bacterium]
MTSWKRSFFAGMTDYTGVPMDVILSHLRDWRDNTVDTISQLKRLQERVDKQRDKLDSPDDVSQYIDFFVDLFTRYQGDFERLLTELPRNVSDAHLEILRQIYESSKRAEDSCIRFKQDHIARGLKDESLRGLVDRIYAESRDMVIDYKDLSNLIPRLRTFVGTNYADDDRRFALMAIEEAQKSVPEDGRPHPMVGAVVVKNGTVISKSHRGEIPQCHAEYIALDKKLPDDLVAGATIYTTLEPCTARKHPKIPCAQRLVDRKVARVVIGMLDPNPEIRGLGDQLLSDANIEIQMFPRDLRAQVEEMNREFIRAQRQKQTPKKANEIADVAATTAARLLTDATREVQEAAWSFYELHTQHMVARAVKDIANKEEQIRAKIAAARRVFAQDYDVPTDLAAVAVSELGAINIALVKLFSTSDQTEMEIAATQVQDACEKIRKAAKPYAYRSPNG